MASKENIYFLRSFLLLIEGGLYISKEILSRECQKSENDLDELLKINERKLKHLFHDKQYKKLYPEFGKADINSWDLQLSVGVLINVFGRHLKLVEKEKLRTLRDIRNDIYMHCTTAALDEKEYEDVKEQLDDIITTLASTFDISVQQRCSNYIKQFTSEQLDAIRPSSQTLNGFSQLCQKKFKVGVETELVIGGPSTNWISLCEFTLETIFNHAESMASEDGGFQEIEENVKAMLSYLKSNKDVVFKGCKRKCIILFFECDDYESFLNFLDKVDSQEYTCYLRDLSNSLHSFFKPKNPISITSKVTSESLQSVMIDIIKRLTNEEEERRHVFEVSSEDNIHENKAIATASHCVNKVKQLTNQKEASLSLNLELQSEEALLQVLQSFQGKQFSDSLKKVADSLSRHHGGEITLKASMDVGAMLEALEDSVSSSVTVAEETKTPESIYAMTSKDDLHSLSADKVCIMKSVMVLRDQDMLENMMDLLSRKGLFTHQMKQFRQMKHFRMNRKRKADIFISMVLTGPIELLKGFKQCLQDREYGRIQRIINSKGVTLKDITVLAEQEGSRSERLFRQNIGKPFLNFTFKQKSFLFEELENANDIAASLLSKMIISGKEFLKISLQPARRMGITVLLDILEKCPEKHLDDFYSALRENGYNHMIDIFVGIKQGQVFPTDYVPDYLYGEYAEYTSRYQPVFTPGHFGHYPLGTYGGGYKPATISSEKQTSHHLPNYLHGGNYAHSSVLTPRGLRRTYARREPAIFSSEKQTSQKDSKQEVETILRRRQEIITKQAEYQHAKTKVHSLKAAYSEPDILQKVTDIADPFMKTDSDEEFDSFDELWKNIFLKGKKGSF